MVKLANAKIDLRVLAEQLETAKSGGKGGVSFEAFTLLEMETILQTCLLFHMEVPEHERHRMIHSGIFKAGEKGAITTKTLLPAITKLERQYLRLPLRNFTLLTTVSVPHGTHLLPVRNRQAAIRFFASAPRRYQRRPEKTLLDWPEELDPPNHAVVTVTVNARDPHAAHEQAVSALDRLRSSWNYALNRSVAAHLWAGKPQPVNKIRVGPFQTLHESSGALAFQSYWYQPLYRPLVVSDLQREWPAMQKDAAAVQKWLRRHPYAAEITYGLVRYTRALDSSDFNVVFLELWGVLELLTNTIGGKYDQTIRRTLFLFGQTELNRLVLEHLRTYRNSIVHHGASQSEAEAYTLQLKNYVEAVIYFHLVWRGRFKSLVEFGDYLELPGDVADLKRQLRWYRRAVRFRASGSPRAETRSETIAT